MTTPSSIPAWRIHGQRTWRATVHMVAKSRTRLKRLSTHARGEGGEGREKSVYLRWVPQRRRSHRTLPCEGRECWSVPRVWRVQPGQCLLSDLPVPDQRANRRDAKKKGQPGWLGGCPLRSSPFHEDNHTQRSTTVSQ